MPLAKPVAPQVIAGSPERASAPLAIQRTPPSDGSSPEGRPPSRTRAPAPLAYPAGTGGGDQILASFEARAAALVADAESRGSSPAAMLASFDARAAEVRATEQRHAKRGNAGAAERAPPLEPRAVEPIAPAAPRAVAPAAARATARVVSSPASRSRDAPAARSPDRPAAKPPAPTSPAPKSPTVRQWREVDSDVSRASSRYEAERAAEAAAAAEAEARRSPTARPRRDADTPSGVSRARSAYEAARAAEAAALAESTSSQGKLGRANSAGARFSPSSSAGAGRPAEVARPAEAKKRPAAREVRRDRIEVAISERDYGGGTGFVIVATAPSGRAVEHEFCYYQAIGGQPPVRADPIADLRFEGGLAGGAVRWEWEDACFGATARGACFERRVVVRDDGCIEWEGPALRTPQPWQRLEEPSEALPAHRAVRPGDIALAACHVDGGKPCVVATHTPTNTAVRWTHHDGEIWARRLECSAAAGGYACIEFVAHECKQGGGGAARGGWSFNKCGYVGLGESGALEWAVHA